MSLQKELEDALIQYNESYRVGNPEISDQEYDELFDILKSTYPNSKLLKKSIFEKPATRKVKLPIKMASLEKKKTIEEIIKWGESVGLNKDDKLVISPKWDGISLCVNESSGLCITRGDGEVGQNSTEHFKFIGQASGEDFISFGEAIMSKSYFETHWSDKYKTARNLVAGLFNRDEVSSDLMGVQYIKYGTNLPINKIDQLEKLKKQSGQTTDYFIITFGLIKDKGAIELMNRLYNHWGLGYSIDGLVIDINDYQKRESVGRLENGNPNYAVAFKNPEWNCKYTPIVTGIERNVSKQGKIKPVILIEPTDIDGVIVSRVTGYNAKHIINNEISEGAEIEIVRSGEVIPKHIKTLKSNPDTLEALIDDYMICPSCGEPCKWDETMTEIVCVNNECEGIQLSKLEHFFATAGIEEFGRPSIESLYRAGYKTILSILEITKEELSSLEGWGESSADTVITQFKKLKEVGIPFEKLLHALDLFEGVLGEKTAKLALETYDIEYLIAFSFDPIKELCSIKGVSDKTAHAIMKALRFWADNQLGNTLPICIAESQKVGIIGDSCKGMKVCFTGIRDKELEDYITSNGGEIVSGVSKTTTHLIVKDMSEATLSSSKSVKAKELNITIQTINQFKQN